MSGLEVAGLHLRHPGAERDAVRDLFLAIRRGDALALVGPNGSGKSTLLAALAGQLLPRIGRLADADGGTWRAGRELARRVAYLPQSPRAPEGLTVEQLVLSGRNPHLRLLERPGRADRSAAAEALAAVDLGELQHRKVETLSGGERRRAWLAMTLAQGAETLLLDEPMAGLDIGHRLEVEGLLGRLRRERGLTLVVVIHDLAAAVRLAERVAVLHRGRLYAAGETARILTRETLADVFGVEGEVLLDDGRPALVLRGPATGRRPF